MDEYVCKKKMHANIQFYILIYFGDACFTKLNVKHLKSFINSALQNKI